MDGILPKLQMQKEEKDLLLGYYDRKIRHIKMIRKGIDTHIRTDNEIALSLDIQLIQLQRRREQLLDELIVLMGSRSE